MTSLPRRMKLIAPRYDRSGRDGPPTVGIALIWTNNFSQRHEGAPSWRKCRTLTGFRYQRIRYTAIAVSAQERRSANVFSIPAQRDRKENELWDAKSPTRMPSCYSCSSSIVLASVLPCSNAAKVSLGGGRATYDRQDVAPKPSNEAYCKTVRLPPGRQVGDSAVG